MAMEVAGEECYLTNLIAWAVVPTKLFVTMAFVDAGLVMMRVMDNAGIEWMISIGDKMIGTKGNRPILILIGLAFLIRIVETLWT